MNYCFTKMIKETDRCNDYTTDQIYLSKAVWCLVILNDAYMNKYISDWSCIHVSIIKHH